MKSILSILTLSTSVLFAASAMADDDARIYEQNKNQYITHAKASKIAKSHVKGVRVNKVDFDHDNRFGAHFNVEVVANGGAKYEVAIDAVSGKVLHSEIED